MKKYSELYVPSLNDLKNKKEDSFVYVDNQGKISVAENLLLNPDNFLLQKENNNYKIESLSLPTLNLLIVAGGGGTHARGGGGAGGCYFGTYSLTSTATITQSITIGSGGAPGSSGNTNHAGKGGNTTAFGVLCYGGGRGGTAGGSSGYPNGGTGGSGGGADTGSYGPRQHNPLPSEPSGNRGGGSSGYSYGGGGGGSASEGGNASQGGKGGNGRQWLDGNYYAAGGNGLGADGYGNTTKSTDSTFGKTPYNNNGVANSGSGAGAVYKRGGSGVVGIRYSKQFTFSYTYTGNSTLDTTSSTTHNFLYLQSSGTLNLTYEPQNFGLLLKNTNVNIESESEFENISTEKIYDQGNSYSLKGEITQTASGKPLFDVKGSVKLLKDDINKNLKISHFNKGLFSPESEEYAWKSWADRHDTSYTTIQNLIGKIGNLNYGTHSATTSEKDILIESDLTDSAIYGLGNPDANSFRYLTWHSILNGYLADTFANFVGDGSTNLGTHLSINTSDLTRFTRKNIYYFVQFTGLSKMIVTLPNPVNSNGDLIYPRGSMISVFLRKHSVNPSTTINNRYVDFYVSDGTRLTINDLTSLGYGYYHYPYYYALPDSENIEISIPSNTLYEGWFKFDFISMRDDNNNLQDTWKFIKSGFA